MPRQYGTTNIMPYATAPAVGAIGDQYYNTAQKVTYVSDGTAWIPSPTAAYAGWVPSMYTWTAVADNVLMVQDNNGWSLEYQYYNVGTRVRWQQSGIVGYGTVISQARGTASATLPIAGATYDTTTDVFTTGAAHGLANGDIVYFTAATGGFVPGSTPYWVIGVTSTTFQISASSGGAAVNMAGANGTVTVNSGQVLTLAPNPDYGVVRGTALGGPGGSAYPPQYSYALCPAFWPGWFRYAVLQNVNPLTYTGYSSNPATLYQYRVDGNMVTIIIRDTTNGTSNANTITMSLPVTASSVANGLWLGSCRLVDNNVTLGPPGCLSITSAGTTLTAFKDWTATNIFTTSGLKRVASGTVIYPI